MREVIAVAGDVLVSESGEEDLFARQIVQKRITQLLTDLFLSFPTCIEKACFVEDSEADAPVTNQDNPPIEQMLIIGLSNMKYTREKCLNTLMEQFGKLNFPDVTQTQKVCSVEYVNLSNRLFEAYIEHRVEPLIGTIEPSMYLGDFDWNDCPKPTGVRSYIKILLMKIISVHSEVFSISPSLVNDILSEVVRTTSEEILRVMQCVSNASSNGAFQAHLDISVLMDSTSAFASQESRNNFEEALKVDVLPPLRRDAVKSLEILKNQFKSSLLFNLRCFAS